MKTRLKFCILFKQFLSMERIMSFIEGIQLIAILPTITAYRNFPRLTLSKIKHFHFKWCGSLIIHVT